MGYIVDLSSLIKNQGNKSQGNKSQGNKSQGMIEAIQLGLQVPNGFIISAETYKYFKNNDVLPQSFEKELTDCVRGIEKHLLKTFGKIQKDCPPLLFSIRCGEKRNETYLPDSLINIGLQSFEEDNPFLSSLNTSRRYLLSSIINDKTSSEERINNLIKMEPIQQLIESIKLIFNKFKEIESRNLLITDYSLLIQEMIYGDYDQYSASGTAYTRNPYTLKQEDYGKYINMSGHFINIIATDDKKDLTQLKSEMPLVYTTLKEIFVLLEQNYSEPRYVEFIIQSGKIYILQNSSGKYLVPRIEKASSNIGE